MDEYFAAFMKDTYGFDLDTPMSSVVAWAGEHMKDKRADIEDIGKLQERLHYLKLPQKMIMLNVDDHPDVDESQTAAMAGVLLKYSSLLSKHGVVFGLSSSGILSDLKDYARKIGIEDCPCLSLGGRELHHNRGYFYEKNLTTETTLELLGELGHTIALFQASSNPATLELLDTQLADLCQTLETN
jgi:hypothetical protein